MASKSFYYSIVHKRGAARIQKIGNDFDEQLFKKCEKGFKN